MTRMRIKSALSVDVSVAEIVSSFEIVGPVFLKKIYEISRRHSTKILKFSWWFSLQFDEHVLHALSGNNKCIK
jgi:hypothetical protein